MSYSPTEPHLLMTRTYYHRHLHLLPFALTTTRTYCHLHTPHDCCTSTNKCLLAQNVLMRAII
ncbi:hypothetical protein BC938DRAFT_480520 [Jimgerdemannia flammicorona]|uniref:Uncharacterized protein n=1 Tax=Jimgerdemannia flammicorona TaxID=994334 RepID=A0A433QIC3_9FUNG|nr:hypothetical protein BC938DRAFT_480520 [Jimgerdemannia flammicorona]